MSIGLVVTKSDVDQWAGTIARELDEAVTRIEKFKAWLDTKTDADLTLLGYDASEIASLKSAYADAAQFASLFRGTATLTAAKDFSVFLRRVWGFGAL